MTTTRKLIWAFWIFIIIVLAWQFYTYNQGMTQQAIDHPQQEHFYFYHTNIVDKPGQPAPVKVEGALVKQISFKAEENKPGQGSFTCSVTLKNVGNAKAVGVQIHVFPFKGAMVGEEEAGSYVPVKDTDPAAQLGQWVTFPDLAPGEASTQTAVFLMKPNIRPGSNPGPEIVFATDKNSPTSNNPKPNNSMPQLPGAGG